MTSIYLLVCGFCDSVLCLPTVKIDTKVVLIGFSDALWEATVKCNLCVTLAKQEAEPAYLIGKYWMLQTGASLQGSQESQLRPCLMLQGAAQAPCSPG